MAAVTLSVLTHSAGVERRDGDLSSNQTKQERLENVPAAADHGRHRRLETRTSIISSGPTEGWLTGNTGKV